MVVALGIGPATASAASPRSSGRSHSSTVQHGVLFGVSCTSATACTAVGYDLNSTGNLVTLAERWDGETWATESTTAVSGQTLFGVSCTSATTCIAVGSGPDGALAEGWNGTKWTVETVPSPTGSSQNGLSAVSCASATACTAVGSNLSSNREGLALVERWNGKKWTVEPTTAVNSQALSAVSCTSATACSAVGSGSEGPLAESWNGTKWTVETIPTPAGSSDDSLSAVSCASATACTAVGSDLKSTGHDVTLVERWNGKKWAFQPSPKPHGATGSFFAGVSCASAESCTADGFDKNTVGDFVTLAEGWNGTRWAIEATPNPAHIEITQLYGVSCASAAACTAVGTYVIEASPADTNVTVTQGWNGSKWTVEP
jgi:hypothetical protein